jgi:hypothetical protein
MMAGRNDRMTGWKQKIKKGFSSKAGDMAQTQPMYPSGTGKESKMNPDWIDIDTLRYWLRVCDTEHGDRCKLAKVAAGYPRWLVDVERLCLVQAKAGDRYVALSYVWGQVECAQAMRSNLEHLQQPGAISDSGGNLVIPRTIRDAIRLVVLLGERLMWVDSLRIVQDDAESKHVQLNEMASIYANAYVTVIAANGWDANHGLRGIKGVTEYRMLSSDLNQDVFESLQPYSTIWYNRGWTFQELIFSRRKIMFQYQMAIWECSCGVWHEATPRSEIGLEAARNARSVLDDQAPPGFVSCTPFEVKPNLDWPDLQQYMNLVRNYNDRQLTYPEDVIAGFSGVLSTLSSVFVGGFISGLPEMFFDSALLWQPASPLERRVPLSKGSKISVPSWSWAGWRGDIDKDTWASGCIQKNDFSHRDFSSFRSGIKSICQWSCGDGKTWRKLDIAHKCLDDRLQYIRRTKKLPDGWSMKRINDSGKTKKWSMKVTSDHQHYFSHKLMPGQKFFYPVAIGGGACSQNTNDSSTLLSCRTRRIWLRIGNQVKSTSYQVASQVLCPHWGLHTKDDESCGIIRLNVSPTYLPEGAADPMCWTPCELIAISESSTLLNLCSDDELRSIFGSPSLKDMTEFYNVLWIEWVDGIAYRKALGQVLKSVWNSYPDEWIDVVLG